MNTPGTSRFRRWVRRSALLATGTVVLSALAFLIAWHAFPLPDDFLTPGPPGALVLDRDGGTLLDVVGSDEQRRIPIGIEEVGDLIPLALIAAEDRSFRQHAGIDPLAIIGALRDNARAGKVVRGGSTLTMQVAGLRMDHPRTYLGKAAEAFRALQIEARHDKDRILQEWLNTAPFGGNLVGIEAASRSWLGKPAQACTLAEAALLIGLPNAPERFRPDRHPDAATRRKTLILDRMLDAGDITATEHADAIAQEIRIRPRVSSDNDRHAGWLAIDRSGRGRVLETTIDPEIQSLIETMVTEHGRRFSRELDIAVVLVDVESAAIRALIGSTDALDPRDGRINGTTARRSPGSTLKPFLYALAFEERRLAPDSIVSDAPLDLDGWRPRNIERDYLGSIPADEALRRSRNTPALRIARDLGLHQVIASLRRCGLSLPPDVADRAGLSIAVGGVEVPPIELAEAYATLARGGVHRPLRLIEEETASSRRVFSRETCTALESALIGSQDIEGSALPFIAAKTGTSSGLRDALAAGWNARHAVVVWIGRFDGGSDPALVGRTSALPLLEQILNHPRLQTTRPMRPHVEWVVRDQVAADLGPDTPRIIEPRDGDRFVASNGEAWFTPRIEGIAEGRSTLFLDGRRVDAGRIRVGLGTHELRMIPTEGPPHAIDFEVVPRPATRR